MKVIITTKEDAAKQAAEKYVELLAKKPDAVLGLATGSTPLGLYAELARLCDEGKLSFARASSYNLDEYVGLDGSHDQSYRYFMDHNLFRRIDIRPENTHVPSGFVENDEEAAQYDAEIAAAGGVDLQLLGIGRNGHIGFNEPADAFTYGTHVVNLSQNTIDANARFFDSVDDVPRQAISMGIGNIMACRSVVLIATGESKAEAILRTVHGPIDPHVPASILSVHPSVTILLDREAASLLPAR